MPSCESFRSQLKGQLKAVQLLQEMDLDARAWEILVLIALNEGKVSKDLALEHGISTSAMNRHVAFLCGEVQKKSSENDGVKYIEKIPDQLDPRRQNLHLTKAGKDFIEQIQNFIAG